MPLTHWPESRCFVAAQQFGGGSDYPDVHLAAHHRLLIVHVVVARRVLAG
ncbi:hypothetical protein ACWDTG_17865 [Rhodococcus zopfii]|nr:hypothetical protein [Rhodococcus zopfii]